MKKVNLAILLAVSALGTSVWAQEYSPQQPAQPEPGVAHISLIHGDVSMQRGDSGDWVATTLNTPIVRGDQIATGERSRTEVQLDYANIVRLSARSQVKIADLTRTHIQLQVSEGYANFSSFKGSEADVEIDTPNVAVKPLKHGRYRIQVNSDSETDVIVREGEAEITTPQGSTTVKEGQLITVRGTDSPEYRIAEAPARDDWDKWNKDRDHVIQEAEGWRHTNRYYTGASDLDAYGHWAWIPGYGNLWAPYQPVGWAPYSYGRWVWEPYWGWTWVSYEPWGWAPYHYGRWFFQAGYWYWWPGPIYPRYRPVWAPAYVFFLGFGHHVNFGFGFSSIGWLPCGPHDFFYPWYGRGFNRINVINVVNVTNITNVRNVTNIRNGVVVPPLAVRGRQPLVSNASLALTNARIRQAVTTVPMDQFGRGVTSDRRQGVQVADLRQASLVAGNLPVVPTRESLQPSSHDSGSALANITPRNTNHFFARSQPPAALPAFQEQANRVQEVIRMQGGEAQLSVRNSTGSEAATHLQGAGASTTVNNATGAQVPGNAAGQQRVSTGDERMVKPAAGTLGGNGQQPATGSPATLQNRPPANSEGWRRFGQAPTEGMNAAGTVHGGSGEGRLVASATPAPDMQKNNGKNDPGSSKQETSKQNSNDNKSTGSNKGTHDGWQRFGSGSGSASTSAPANDRGTGEAGRQPTPGTTNSGQNNAPANSHPANSNSNKGEDWHKFTPPDHGPGEANRGQTNQTRTGSPAQNPGSQQERIDRGNTGGSTSDFHRFPNNSPGGSGNGSRGSDSPKPPLTIDHPIVTPRGGGSEPRTAPSPTPHPEPSFEPRSSPGPSREQHSGGNGGGGNRGGSEPKSNSGSGSHSNGKNNWR